MVAFSQTRLYIMATWIHGEHDYVTKSKTIVMGNEKFVCMPPLCTLFRLNCFIMGQANARDNEAKLRMTLAPLGGFEPATQL